MELSKRALGFLCRQYRIILRQNHLANALGTCALSALMCGTMCATAAFVAPDSALAGGGGAGNIGVEVPHGSTEWVSEGDISVSSTAADVPVYGIVAQSSEPLSITLDSGHMLTVLSVVEEATSGGDTTDIVTGMYVEGIKNTLINNGSIQVSSIGPSGRPTAGMQGEPGISNTFTNAGTLDVFNGASFKSIPQEGVGASAVGMEAVGATNTITNEAVGSMHIFASMNTVIGDPTIGSTTIPATAQYNNGETVTFLGNSASASGIMSTVNPSALAPLSPNTIRNSGSMMVEAHSTLDIINTEFEITADTTPGSATADVDATAYGIMAQTDFGSASIIDISNEAGGAIEVIATAEATIVDATATVNNSPAEVFFNASATATGIWTQGEGTITVTNGGVLHAFAFASTIEGSAANATACGVSSMLAINNSLTNETGGFIHVSASGLTAEAYGMNAMGFQANMLTNEGTIIAESTSTNDSATVCGMNALYAQKTVLTNDVDGTITVSAEGYLIDAGPDAAINAYGMNAGNAQDITFTNTGMMDISSSATGSYAYAFAYGMNAVEAPNPTFINNGTMTVYAESSDKTSEAYGMQAQSAENSVFTNGVEGTMTVSAKGTSSDVVAYGMGAMEAQNIILTNDGTLTVSTEVSDFYTNAYGMGATAAMGGNGPMPLSMELVEPQPAPTSQSSIALTNSGTMNVNAKATVVEGEVPPMADAYGMNAEGAQDTVLTNKGKLTVSAEVTECSAQATGMLATPAMDSGLSAGPMPMNMGPVAPQPTPTSQTSIALMNNGMMDVNAKATRVEGSTYLEANAYGMEARVGMDASQGSVTLTNSGTMNVFAEAQYVEADVPSFAMASGMSADPMRMGMEPGAPQPVPTSQTSIALTNSGKMNVFAEGGEAIATGMSASYGTEMSLTNKGTINVGATALGTNTFANAAGMYIEGSVDSVATINNLGAINASASGSDARAYQAYVASGTANVGTWAITLGESYGGDTGYHVFGVENGATLNFGLDGEGTKLCIAYLKDGGFETGVEYAISDMIENNGGTVTGSIDSITIGSLLFVDLELKDGGTADDYTDQFIVGSLAVNSSISPVQGAANHTVAGVTGHMINIGSVLDSCRINFSGHHSGIASVLQEAMSDTSTMYADASETFTDAGGSYISPESPVWQAFLMPFYSTTSDNGGAYDTNMGGLVLGANRPVGDDFVFGFHASLAKANSDSAYTDSDAISYALGINGVYNVNESLYFSGQLTGFFAENNMDMVAGSGASTQNASASMDSYGMYAKLAAGYDYALTSQHIFTPELALSYLYAHMEGFDSAFIGGGSSTSFSMASENYDALYADASLRWMGIYDLGARENGNALGMLKPTFKVGVRQALTDPEVSSTMNIFGSSATTHADANETAFTCEAGLVWDMGDVNASWTYTGEFGDAETSHMGMFKVEWEF